MRARAAQTRPLRPRRTQAVALGDVLRLVARTRGWEERLRHERAAGEWPGIVGPDLARHTLPLGVRDGVLHVAVRAGVWATQISYFRTDLLQRLRRSGDAHLRDIVFHVRYDLPYPPGQAAPTAAPANTAPLPAAVHRVASSLVADLPETDLADSLRRLYLAAQRRQTRIFPRTPSPSGGAQP